MRRRRQAPERTCPVTDGSAADRIRESQITRRYSGSISPALPARRPGHHYAETSFPRSSRSIRRRRQLCWPVPNSGLPETGPAVRRTSHPVAGIHFDDDKQGVRILRIPVGQSCRRRSRSHQLRRPIHPFPYAHAVCGAARATLEPSVRCYSKAHCDVDPVGLDAAALQ
jgi:hypothetical protein